ncbi:CSC1-like protein RXW8 [Abeliophyllum distichum]|uniref:CSC1-like protein RXW8 n=1 Tax=Abeliophyllum distichum TaxID=126358 RepID=A0ABD1Q6M3_9LAMI
MVPLFMSFENGGNGGGGGGGGGGIGLWLWFRITVKKFGFLHDIEMNISALLTSSGINTAVCAVLFSFYSILRKQPSLVSVYFGQKLAQVRSKRNDPFWFQRFIPSASWIVKSWEASEEELFAIGGLDAVVFLRAVVFQYQSILRCWCYMFVSCAST